MIKEINTDVVNKFLIGSDPMEKIVNIECGYMDEQVNIIYVNSKGEKRIRKDDFKPFVWVKNSACIRMYDGDRSLLKKKLREFGIAIKLLQTKIGDNLESDRLGNGYKYLFYATKPMTYNKFLQFFTFAKTPIYENRKKKDVNEKSVSSREFLAVTPVEQYMMSTGKRLFKGYDNYDDLKRLQFDLETQGLYAEKHAIDQIGIRTNKGYERIITITGVGEERKINELKAIEEFIKILSEEKPDVIAGHNSENFDWNFIIVRCKVLGTTLEDISLKYFKNPIFKRKKETVLKLGGEVEYYFPTIMWGYTIVDSLHAVRRAQAIDSNMKKANLKYVTKYLDLKKRNRVYVPGNQIGSIWLDSEENYGLNESDGDWYKITDTRPLIDGYTKTSGRYIVERYLLDDLYETDKVELKLNESNFLLGKLLPTTFQRVCTMGTAASWKLLMLTWCYENELAVPAFSNSARFTGGLSRLLKVGYADRVVKLDYNSLYPSIILTWDIASQLDISNVMLTMLEYILTEREKFKGLMKKAKKEEIKITKQLENFDGSDEERLKLNEKLDFWKSEVAANDKKQLPFKIFGNSFFGGFGAPDIFPFGDLICAEKTTCIGRMSLRLMISHFTKLGYTPIVGDTDGFNFQMPLKFRYTDENPYIGKGLNRNTKKGVEYTGVNADVAEFNDMFMRKKMGLGIDEYAQATINFSRKNYADWLENGKTKKVGNTIKSRRMSGYIEKFLDEGIDLLLKGNGQKFLENYYDYINKIYNYQIPLRDIASKGKIKKTIEQYKADCETVTKAGTKKSRQAWYELVIQNDVKVQIDDTIYYVNTGTKKSHTDVKRVTHQFTKIDGEIVEIDSKLKREILKKECAELDIEYKNLPAKMAKELLSKHIVKEEDEIILNCKIIPNEIIEADDDVLCDDDVEYNVLKYIDQFNSRIKPLLVCFSPDIRPKILIKNPEERQYFTTEESQLVSGFPNKETDQDTYEQLMSLERKEIEYWTTVNEIPPFVEECNMDWGKIVNDFNEIKKQEEDIIFQEENEKYLKALDDLTEDEITKFEEEDIIPNSLSDIVVLNSDMHFYFKKLPNMRPTTGGSIIDDLVYTDKFLVDKSEKEYVNYIANDFG
jgi:DNA polymerase elongation subunit (family B)